MSDSYDDMILEALAGISRRRKGLSVCTDTISFATGIEPRTVGRRMRSMEKYGLVRRKVTQKVDYWGI